MANSDERCFAWANIGKASLILIASFSSLVYVASGKRDYQNKVEESLAGSLQYFLAPSST